MYDKVLLASESREIAKHIPPLSRVCDAGCGEGEGTAEYAAKALEVEAFDNSDTRLAMAKARLAGSSNIVFYKQDVREPFGVGGRFEVVVSQRVLINLSSWEEQKKAFDNMVRATKKRLILSEGSNNGVGALNAFRGLYGLPPIPVPSHNRFLDDDELLNHAHRSGLMLVESVGLGAFYLLTRGVQPVLKSEFHWASMFNMISSGDDVKKLLPSLDKFARVKIWVFDKSH